MARSRLHLAVLILMLAGAQGSLAQPAPVQRPGAGSVLPAPTQGVILTVTGNIAVRNGKDGASFDAAMIDALPRHEFRTWTPWFKEPRTFSGPRLQTVLDAIGAKGTTLRLVALNDYAVDVPFEDARRFDPLLARRIDGKPLGVRDKGPLFLIYPFDARPETRNDLFYSRSIWQLTRMTVQ